MTGEILWRSASGWVLMRDQQGKIVAVSEKSGHADWPVLANDQLYWDRPERIPSAVKNAAFRLMRRGGTW